MDANSNREHLQAWVVDGPPGWRRAMSEMLASCGFRPTMFEHEHNCPDEDDAMVILYGANGLDESEKEELVALTHRYESPVILFVSPWNLNTSRAGFRLGAADVCELLLGPRTLCQTIESTIHQDELNRHRRERLLGAL